VEQLADEHVPISAPTASRMKIAPMAELKPRSTFTHE